MARTKKEIEEQAPDAEPETTGLSLIPSPRLTRKQPPGEVANAGVTDLELAAAKSLDPDAPRPTWNRATIPMARQLRPRLTRNGTRMTSPSLARRDFRPRLTWNLPTRIPVPILTWNRLKLPAMARPLMPSRRPVPKLSWKWNWLMITRPRLRGMTRLKKTPSRLPPPGAGAPPVRRQQRRRMGERTRPQSIRRRSNLILGSPRNSACRAGAASGWYPSTPSGR